MRCISQRASRVCGPALQARSVHSHSHAPVSISQLLYSPPPEVKEITVNGFIRSIRNQKTRSFASVGDGSSLEPMQALLTPQQAQSLTTGSAVRLAGSWQLSPNPVAQKYELHVTSLTLLGPADASFPLQKKYHTPEYLRTIPHIRTRTPFNAALLRFRSASVAALSRFFEEREFTQTHTPTITSSDCEGAGEVFGVDSATKVASNADQKDAGFFRSGKYLTVSSQLHLEALAQSVGRVWTLSPSFRAERSDTPRHLSEFYMLEVEETFVDSNAKVMDLVEDMLRNLTTSLYNTRVGQELIHGKRPDTGEDTEEILESRWKGMMAVSWPRITYTDAVAKLQASTEKFDHPPTWGKGLQAEHERYIAKTIGHGSPVFVTAYPRSIKPFYMLPSEMTQSAARETVECFDLLVPDLCEIAGGSMREHRLGPLMEMMQAHGIDAETLKWYIDLRRWGSVPHGGFGLGFDRLLGYLAGVENLRDIVAFPRWVGRCDC